MDTTIESLIEYQDESSAAVHPPTILMVLIWIQRLALVGGLIGLAVSFFILPQSTELLAVSLASVAVSSLLEVGFKWRALKRTAERQNWRRYGCLQEVIQRLEDGLDVVSPVIPTIEVDGQTLVVLRAWSAKTGKATLLLNQDGRAIMDQGMWRRSVMLIEFANACLPGVSRNRRAIIKTNLYARHLASKAWRQSLNDNKDIFNSLGLSAEVHRLVEHWESLEAFLSLRVSLFQAEEDVVERVTVPTRGQYELEAWIGAQERIHQAMETLAPNAEKISETSSRLLTAWMENKTDQNWKKAEELEAGLKFAYLFQTLLKRTQLRWRQLQEPDLKTFQRGIDLARQNGLMVTHNV